ncbi:matrixin family metalloprotease [Winogradskyella litoriviva]|uniref:Matrixin family metalloprotease n=1 Tax=Winogradskyella litoriviva TaxID=1220182 RepID=A0ABX2E7D1_9FLAO|nr:matrixin family metalloprotease [Winogradskyella litoriviva]NRD24436.1 matrixin family metalloprotease [Winogradskyella litoriviva]
MNKPILFFIFLLFCFSCSTKPKLIGIQPFGNIDQNSISVITKNLTKTYNCNVVVLNNKEIPNTAFVNIKSPRYRADSLLIHLIKIKPDSIDYILGVTSKDISITKRDSNGDIKKPENKYSDWGIFGLGYRPGQSCIISTFRLKNTKSETYKNRLRKISVHEIGHNLGLNHCPSENCVMQDAVETIKTVDKAGFGLCKKCLQKIN